MFELASTLVHTSRRILLITHVAPDGDAIGSLLGMAWLLRTQGKQVVPACQDGVPAPLRWLPGWVDVVKQVSDPFDLVIALDCSDLQRLGTAYDAKGHGQLPLVNIDHHVTNMRFGAANIVVPKASSTAEVVYGMAQDLGWPVGREAAQCLLTGLVTDTRGFRTPNVTAHTLGIAQALMGAGASLTAVTERVLDRLSFGILCVWGHALSTAHLDDRVIWTAVPQSMRAQCGVEQSDSGLSSFLLAAEEADIAAVFAERDDGTVDVGLRAVPGVDVSQVALQLGGGGHPQAAGCNLRLPMEEAQHLVLPLLHAAVNQQLGHAELQDPSP